MPELGRPVLLGDKACVREPYITSKHSTLSTEETTNMGTSIFFLALDVFAMVARFVVRHLILHVVSRPFSAAGFRARVFGVERLAPLAGRVQQGRSLLDGYSLWTVGP